MFGVHKCASRISKHNQVELEIEKSAGVQIRFHIFGVAVFDKVIRVIPVCPIGGGMVILLGALLILSYNGEVTVANTLVIFFATRLQNGSLTASSRSLMRYAKAKAGAKVRDDFDDE